jgi:hypothetical protein
MARRNSGTRFIFGIDTKPMKFKGFKSSGNPFRGAILMQEGGIKSDTISCSNCGWSWKKSEGGNDATTCHKCGNVNSMQDGGSKKPSLEEVWKLSQNATPIIPKPAPAKPFKQVKIGPTTQDKTDALRLQMEEEEKQRSIQAAIESARNNKIGTAPIRTSYEQAQIDKQVKAAQEKALDGNFNYKKGDDGFYVPNYGSTGAKFAAVSEKASDRLLEPAFYAGNIAGAPSLLRHTPQFLNLMGRELGRVGNKIGRVIDNVNLPSINTLQVDVGRTLLNNKSWKDKMLKGIDEGNQWSKEWFSHPITKERYNNFLYRGNPYLTEKAALENSNIGDVFGNIDVSKHDYIKGINLDKSFAAKNHATVARNNYDKLLEEGKLTKGVTELLDPSRNTLGRYSYSPNDAKLDILHPSFLTKGFKPKETTIHENIHMLTRGDKAMLPESKKLLKSPFKHVDDKYDKYLTEPTEIHARIGEIRSNFNLTPDAVIYDELVDDIIKQGLKGKTSVDKQFFKLIKDKEAFKNVLQNVPVTTGVILGAGALQQKQKGGPIVDPMGQYNHPGKETIIPTQDGRITMKNIPYPIIGIDETGQTQFMRPNGEYQFRGKRVHEIPLMQQGGSIVDFLVSQGKDHRMSARKKIAEDIGIQNYSGTAEQNLKMLLALRGNQNTQSTNKNTKVVNLNIPEYFGGAPKTTVINPKGKGVLLNVPQNLIYNEPKKETVKEKKIVQFPKQRFIQSPSSNIIADSPESRKMNIMKQDSKDLGINDFAKKYKQLIKASEPGLLNLGVNYIARQYQKMFGDDEKAISRIEQPKNNIKIDTTNNQNNIKNVIPFIPPIITGDTLWDSKERGTYHIPEVIDLNRVKLGARNRGENTPVESDGFIFGAFGRPGSDESKGYTKVRNLDNDVFDDKVYIGIDDNGDFKLDYGKNIRGKKLKGYQVNLDTVKSFAWEGNNVKQQRDNGNAGSNVPIYTRPDGTEGTVNLLMPRNNKNREDVFSTISGGRVVVSTPDLKRQFMLSGSVRTISEQLEKFKKDNNVDHVLLTHVDNGSYSRGYRNSSGLISNYGWSEHDARNNTGGAGFYLKGKGYQKGGLINPYKMKQGGLSMQDAYKFLFDDEEETTDVENITAPSDKELEEQYALGEKNAAKKYGRQLRAMKNNQAAMQLINDNGELSFDNYISPKQGSNPYKSQSSSTSNLKGTTLERAKQAVDYLQTQHGLPKHVAAGIAGNAVQESSFSDSVISGNRKGDNGQSFGLFQWYKDRNKGFFNWAKQNNKNPYDYKTQLDYGVIEAKQRGDLQHVLNTTNAAQAANVWRDRFEKPAVKDGNRAYFANELMKYKVGGEYDVDTQTLLELRRQGYKYKII